LAPKKKEDLEPIALKKGLSEKKENLQPIQLKQKIPEKKEDFEPPKENIDFDAIDEKSERKALSQMGNHSGRIYVIVNGGMGGFWIVRRDAIGGKLEVYWSYDDQYEEPAYKTAKKFIEHYKNVGELKYL